MTLDYRRCRQARAKLVRWQRQLLRRGLEETASLWPAVREAYKWVQRVARILKNEFWSCAF